MKCFYHGERDAVALCKSCQRGLCPDCVSDVPPGVACRGKCETEVGALNRVFEQSKRAFDANQRVLKSSALPMILFAMVFIGVAVALLQDERHVAAIVPMGIALVMLTWSYLSYRNAKYFSDRPEKN